MTLSAHQIQDLHPEVVSRAFRSADKIERKHILDAIGSGIITRIESYKSVYADITDKEFEYLVKTHWAPNQVRLAVTIFHFEDLLTGDFSFEVKRQHLFGLINKWKKEEGWL